ncbi:MAG: hypothetical protein NC331_09130 [Lachnospiraceae bacterium]|nr:hypothetical protein [Lachnospiraceae bacterium]MCM1239533.1 hypothetical protein [Lachnospiraceae bacterium]
MAAFFAETLDEFPAPAFLEKVRGKFHYAEEQLPELQAAAEEMLPLMREEAFWESRSVFSGKPCRTEAPDAEFAYVVMSLGKGIDRLQESYSEKGLLTQSYMIEVLAGELLLEGYGAYNRYVRKNTDLHVARYHFPGSEEAFPLEMLPKLLGKLTREVTCNPAFCMVPKKSVAFVCELTRDENVRCQGICVGCGNLYCPNRVTDDDSVRKRLAGAADMPLTYGYSRIFGIDNSVRPY